MAGSGRISPGFLFLPSDQVLLDFYLRGKVDGHAADDPTLAAIPTVDLFGRDAPPPWLLHPAAAAPTSSKRSSSSCSSIVPNKVTEWFYCFARTSRRGPGYSRTTNCGTWLTSGGDKRVTTESDEDGGAEEGVTLGYKCTLAFKISAGGGSKWIPTSWVMHEFKLHHGHPDVRRMEKAAAEQLVLCRIRCTKAMEPCAFLQPAGEELGRPPQKRQKTAGCCSVVGDSVDLEAVRSEGEGRQSSLAVAAPAAALDPVDPTEGEGYSHNPPQQQVVTSGAGLDVELVRTEGECCIQNPSQQQVATPGAGLDSAAAPFAREGEIPDDCSWMPEAAPDEEMWGMLLSFLNE